MQVKIGIIGGSGLEEPNILKDFKEIDATTRYGKPSGKLVLGKINDVDVVIVSRHGKEHSINPTNVNNRANIWALKEQECTHILAATACGSLRHEIKPGDLVFADQFIDRTTKRHQTFYENNQVCHIPMAEPFCPELRKLLVETAKELGIACHEKGTVITIEGPRFSTKAESKMFRLLGGDVINMSTVPEAVLSREAGMCYQAIAMSTDYDCWHETEEPVTIDIILQTMKKNADNVKKLWLAAIPKIKEAAACSCKHDIKTAVIGGKENKVDIRTKIRTVPNFPKPGIMFRDITTLLKDPEGWRHVLQTLTERYKNKGIDIVAGIESRGFIIGGALAEKIGAGFVPIRKAGKLPAEVVRQEYALEYGTDKIEMHKDAIQPETRVLLIDDLIATGGTAEAACKLIEKTGGHIVECAFIVDLPDLKGKEKLNKYPVYTMCKFEGE